MAPPAAEPRSEVLANPRLLLQEPLLTTATRVVVALSGGLDSTVLLHLCAMLRSSGLAAPLSAFHVQHGLQDEAEEWLVHCRRLCESLDVPLSSVHLHLGAQGARSEGEARRARYEAFAAHLPEGAVLLQAHHQQDQVETVLFRFLRGSGVRGLSGMPRQRRCGKGWLLRPLLAVPRDELERYARRHGLSWIEDPSNGESFYARNFLRHEVLPLLRSRWSQVDRQVLESAERSADAAVLLQELAEADLKSVQGPHATMLDVVALKAMNAVRRNNLLRHWCARLVGEGAPLLSSTVLARVESELLDAAIDATPMLRWGEEGRELSLRRFGKYVHLVRALPVMSSALDLRAGETLELPAPLGRLLWQRSDRGGLALREGERLQVRFRIGGERIKPVGRPTRELKKLLQELNVPPWLRDLVPLVYRGEELIAVADFVIAEAAKAESGQNALRLVWVRPDLHCGD